MVSFLKLLALFWNMYMVVQAIGTFYVQFYIYHVLFFKFSFISNFEYKNHYTYIIVQLSILIALLLYWVDIYIFRYLDIWLSYFSIGMELKVKPNREHSRLYKLGFVQKNRIVRRPNSSNSIILSWLFSCRSGFSGRKMGRFSSFPKTTRRGYFSLYRGWEHCKSLGSRHWCQTMEEIHANYAGEYISLGCTFYFNYYLYNYNSKNYFK